VSMAPTVKTANLNYPKVCVCFLSCCAVFVSENKGELIQPFRKPLDQWFTWEHHEVEKIYTQILQHSGY